MALPLVPVARVPAAFNAVMLAAPPVPQTDDMNRYMMGTWIDQHSTFPPELWNNYALVSLHWSIVHTQLRTVRFIIAANQVITTVLTL